MKKVGNYLLVSKLGQGQFGVVYKATQQGTNEVYAVKTIAKNKINQNPKLRRLFDTEMAVMSKIKHPNILHLYEYLETTNNYYLVIDYCNNGDLEGHVKKNQCLGEQESVYFLMQIMNGFKELHKHKIMHRDFKLANIFLNDDKVIIGDFGFAKSGSEMATTKLGSPITMAPELLNGGNHVRYTNKADLWSVGVCFYQMIFGQPPWNAMNIADLQNKVRTRSGANLYIPNHPPTTPECKQLLKQLMEPNPNRRIEWYQFFNHQLFDKHSHGNPQPQDMRQSVMFRNHEDRVAKLFQKNRQQKDQPIQLVDPLNIKLDMKNIHREESSQSDKEKERVVSQARQRYVHEKKIIVFIMHTCRKLRNLAKQREKFGAAANGLMYAGLLLLKKGIILNEIAINTLKNRTNTYQLYNFDYFLTTNNCKKILGELTKDQKLYFTLLAHLQKKLQSEVGLNDTRAREIYQLSTDSGTSLSSIAPELRKETRYLIEYQSQRAHTFSPDLNKELAVGLGHLYLSSESETEFMFKNNGIPFDWRDFENRLNMEYINGVLTKAMAR